MGVRNLHTNGNIVKSQSTNSDNVLNLRFEGRSI